jgi:hypothetical protein
MGRGTRAGGRRPKPAAAPRRRPAWRWLALAAAALLVAAWLIRTRDRAPGAPPAAMLPPDPARAMSAEQAYAVTARLVATRQHLESLPYLRRMIELAPREEWALFHDYANALQGASMQGRMMLGLPERATRSSFERIQLMRQALAELDRAQRLADSPRSSAFVHIARARQLGAWGLPWDAWAELRAAAAADPSWNSAALAETRWSRRIASPDISPGSAGDSAVDSAPVAPGPAPRRAGGP